VELQAMPEFVRGRQSLVNHIRQTTYDDCGAGARVDDLTAGGFDLVTTDDVTASAYLAGNDIDTAADVRHG
jgi:hypothetical protein